MSDTEITDEREKSKSSNTLDAQTAIVAEKGKHITRSDKVSEIMVGASTPKTDEKSESKRRSLSPISNSEDTSESEERRRKSKKKKRKRYSTSSGDSNSESDHSSSARKKKHKKKFNLFEVKTQKDKKNV